MTSYAVVETALARLHDASPEAQRGAFRGRIKHLQRLGLPLGIKPGKGKRIEYTRPQIWQLAVSLELSEFGLDPTTIVELISTYWDQLFQPSLEDQAEQKRSAGLVLVIGVALMSSGWRPIGESMQGLVSIGWVQKTSTVDYIVAGNKRRIIVLDTWRMLKDLSIAIEQASEE